MFYMFLLQKQQQQLKNKKKQVQLLAVGRARCVNRTWSLGIRHQTFSD